MFKTNEEIIIIQAKAATPIPTGVVFWSHDKGTAKMLFQLQKDYVNQTLSEGTIVPICLDFVGGRHIYHAVIEDAINGIVSIVLEDNILGYVGRVTGSVYIELPDSRSLDTAGRFTFDIKRSPIDLNTPELEDYYWQGFNEIIQESKRLIDQVESNCETVLNDLSSKVTSLENQTSDIKSKQAEILKSIEEHEVFTKQESSANVINIVTGKSVKIVFRLDFDGKLAGSEAENPNILSSSSYTALINPTTGTWYEATQAQYDAVVAKDGNLYTNPIKSSGVIRQVRVPWKVLESIERSLGPNFFANQGITLLSDKVDFIKNRIGVNMLFRAWGYGSGASGNNLNLTCWIPSTSSWDTPVSIAGGTVKQGTKAKGPKMGLDWQGNFYTLLYAPSSDGTIASDVKIDFLQLEFELELSMDEYFKSMIAANHVGNLATQEEAETGTDNAKAMTPLRTAQQINKKAVTIAGNQTIGGIKNFKDGLMINDVSLSTITRKVIYEADGVGGYFNAADKFTLGASGKIDKIVLLWSRVDDTAGTLLNYSWSQTVLSPDDLVVGNSYRIQMTTDNYKFVTFANESGNVTISGANENSVAPNRIYRIKRIIAYLKN